MIKNTYKKLERTWNTFILYILLMGISFYLIQVSSYKVLRVANASEWLLMGSQILFGIAIFLWFIVSFKDPGSLKRDTNLDFFMLMCTYEASSLCPECEVIRSPRSRHCNLCNSCIDRFDHHCPWINNCIGKGNWIVFYLFTLFQNLYLISIFMVSIVCKQLLSSPLFKMKILVSDA